MLSNLRALNLGSKALICALLCLALAVISLFANHLSAAFSLDRTQYEHLAEIARVYDGKPIYAPMSIEYFSATYTPLYWVVCGWIWKIIGPNFRAAEIVSLIASAAAVWIICRLVWDATEQDLLATTAAGVSLLLVSVMTGFWACQIHIDALHFALTIAGFSCLRSSRPLMVVCAATLLSLAALTKQTGLAYVAAGWAVTAAQSPRRAAVFALGAIGVCGGGLAYLQWSSDGAFYQITVTDAASAPRLASRLLHEVWASQFLGQGIVLLLLSVWPIVAAGSLLGAWRRLATPEYAMLASGMLVSCVAQPKFGSGNNHAVIAFAGLIVCGFHGLHVLMAGLRDTSAADAFRASVVALQTIALAIPAWREGSIRYIDREDFLRFAKVEDVFRQGPTVLYHFPYLSRSFGYRECGHQGDERCRWVNGEWNWSRKPDFLNVPYREQSFDHVILCASVIDDNDPTIRTIRENYTVTEIVPAHSTRPNTLMMRYPLVIMTANRLGATKNPKAGP